MVRRLAVLPGSSPLTRGKRPPACAGHDPGRLIPAHAGKTRPGMPTAPSRPAHPRSRGENATERPGCDVIRGSSPLTRGKRRRRLVRPSRRRLIPAHAGKTRMLTTGRRLRAAHPRSRGENVLQVVGLFDAPGSSPLTRGKLVTAGGGSLWGGLIPAHAGKTTLLCA